MSLAQMVVKTSVTTLMGVSISAVSISALMVSMPGALLHFMPLMAVVTSNSVGGLVLI